MIKLTPLEETVAGQIFKWVKQGELNIGAFRGIDHHSGLSARASFQGRSENR